MTAHTNNKWWQTKFEDDRCVVCLSWRDAAEDFCPARDPGQHHDWRSEQVAYDDEDDTD